MIRILENGCFELICGLAHAVGMLPLHLARRIGAFLGRILFRLDGRHRAIAMDNLTQAFGSQKRPAEIRTIARRVFENLGMVFFEVCWCWRRSEPALARHFRINGWENIRSAHRQGRGVLALTAHFGNWELLSFTGQMIGYPIGTVYRPLDFAPLNRFVETFRARFGVTLIHRRKALRKILKGFSRGMIASLLLDQSVDWYEGVFVDFFGRPTCTNQGMALLHLKVKVPVIPVFLVRRPGGFTAYFLPEIPLIETGDRIRDIETNTENYNRVIESMIRRYPEQWFWVHRRWKIRPWQPWPRE